MKREPLAVCGDPEYVNNVWIATLNRLGWSRKRRKKWLRRQGMSLLPFPDDDFEIDGLDRCWCGVENPYFAPVRGTCGGLGVLYCRCGGDLCVCHNHGEVECYGCEDCQGEDYHGDDDEHQIFSDE